MKLQRHFSRELKGKEYSKWVVVIPPEDIIELGWREGMSLESTVSNDKLILIPKKSRSIN